jgi:hypothetical protein
LSSLLLLLLQLPAAEIGFGFCGSDILGRIVLQSRSIVLATHPRNVL